MRRPTLTKKRIDGFLFGMGFAQGDIEAMTESDQKDYKKEIDAFDSAGQYLAELIRWHKWKQEQKVKSVETSPSLDDLSDEQLDQVMSSVGMHIKRKNENEKTQMDS